MKGKCSAGDTDKKEAFLLPGAAELIAARTGHTGHSEQHMD